MTVQFLGLTLLLATIFPVGSRLVLYGGGLSPVGFYGMSPVVVEMILIVMTYVPAAVVIAWFFRASRLSERVPRPIPGRRFMSAGVALTIFYLGTRLVAAAIGEGSENVSLLFQLSSIVLTSARVLLVVGAVKLLLAAMPVNSSRKSEHTTIPV
jgi:hypothetical protein